MNPASSFALKSSPPATNEMSGEEWVKVLKTIGRELKEPAHLCLIGSGPAMLQGQDGRLTIDLDSLKRRSAFDAADMQRACDRAGVLLDPKSGSPTQPYIQLVDDTEGIVHVGKFKASLPVMTEGKLTVEQAPWANIVASKLVRASVKDIGDVMHITGTYGVTRAAVLEVARTFPRLVRENVEENLVYLDMAQRKAPGLRAPNTPKTPAKADPGTPDV